MTEKDLKNRRAQMNRGLLNGLREQTLEIRAQAQSVYWTADYESKVRRALLRINKLMRFKVDAEIAWDLEDCFDAWYAYYGLKDADEAADAVLSDFYQDGKISFLISELRTFVEEIETDEDPDMVRAEAWHNYVFFLQRNYEKMKQHVREAKERPKEALPGKNADTVSWFVEHECADVAALKDLPQARMYASDLMEKYGLPAEEDVLDAAKKVSEQDVKNVRFTLSAVDILRAECRKTTHNEALLEKTRILKEKTQAREQKITQSTQLLAALDAVFTQEWFAAWNPKAEGGVLRDMNAEELKMFYLKQMDMIKLENRGRDLKEDEKYLF